MKINIPKLPIADCRLPIGVEGNRRRCRSLIKNQKSKIPNAFTLVEMLLVVTIIGILAGLVIPGMVNRSEEAREKVALTAVHGGIKSALGMFEADNGFFPKSLQDLVTQPSYAKNWRGPYLDKLPIDPWNNPYVYYLPGKHSPNSYDLLSVGLDGKEGTADDIVSWN